MRTLLDMMAQFTGGRGDVDYVIVNYAIAGFFWAALLTVAWLARRDTADRRDTMLMWGFGFALIRELFVIAVAFVGALGIISPVALHMVFPPLEHGLHNVALVLLAAAFIQVLVGDSRLSRLFLRVGLSATLAAYVSTVLWWARYASDHPESSFGEAWPDWMFHISRSAIALAAAVVIFTRALGWARNTVTLAFVFFLVAGAMKLPDMAFGERYEETFTPIGRMFYLSAIPIFGYVYVREQWEQRHRAQIDLALAHSDLERQVADRTEALTAALAAAEVASKDLEAFSYSVAHDLKAPLRAMTGFSQVLVEDYGHTLDETAAGYVDNIIAGASRMNALIDDLLQYSRLGRDQVDFGPVDLRGVFDDVVVNLRAEFEATGAELVAPATMAVIEGHRLMIEMLVQNLVANALKYVAPGVTPRVEVTVDADDHECVLTVTDNGIGIDSEYRDGIFEIFRRLHGTSEYSGTGIGLAIVRRVVDLHRGVIQVESTVGVGTSFMVTIPRRQPAPVHAPGSDIFALAHLDET